jgi:hypothetical protein
LHETERVINNTKLKDLLNLDFPEELQYLRDLDPEIVIKRSVYGDTDSIYSELNIEHLKLYTNQTFNVINYKYSIEGFKLKKEFIDPIDIDLNKKHISLIINNKKYLYFTNKINVDINKLKIEKHEFLFDLDLKYKVLTNDNGKPILTTDKRKVDLFCKLFEKYINNINLYKEPMYLAYEDEIHKTILFFSKKKYHSIPLENE